MSKTPADVIVEMATTIQEMKKALEFYADPIRYGGPNQRNHGNDPYTPSHEPYLIDVIRDQGHRASVALKKVLS